MFVTVSSSVSPSFAQRADDGFGTPGRGAAV